MGDEQAFIAALQEKKVPILTLDQKWHRLFAIHGKTEEIKELETSLNGLLVKQGKLTNELKDLKRLKSKLMGNIVQNMDDADSTMVSNDGKMIDEINEKMEAYEDELLELPEQIKEINKELMLKSMDYFYDKLKVNREESREIDEWITQMRIELKKNIIRKQNRDINNREIYAYLHDIFGPEVIDLFDVQMDDSQGQK